MYQREFDRRSELERTPPRPAPPRRSVNPVLALQRAIGNRGTTRVLARDKKRKKNAGTFAHGVTIGELGPIEIKGGNVQDWVDKKDPETLTLTTVKGKHSKELKRLADSKAPIDVIETESVVGENSIVVIKFRNARITGYTADEGGKTEEWKVVDFTAVNRSKISIGAAR